MFKTTYVKKKCQFCFSSEAEENLISPCNCRGRYAHRSCWIKWLQLKEQGQCNLCQPKTLTGAHSRRVALATVKDRTEVKYTYSKYSETLTNVAKAFLKFGLKPLHSLLFTSNCPEWCFFVF